MPRRDGTGPMGFGALTGRKLGNCNVKSDSANTKKEVLKQQQELLKSQLDVINKDLENL